MNERMHGTGAVIVVSVALAVAMVLTPIAALAGGGRGGPSGGPSMRGGGPPGGPSMTGGAPLGGRGRGSAHGWRSGGPHARIPGKWPDHGFRPGPGGRPVPRPPFYWGGFPHYGGGGFPYYGGVWYEPPSTNYYVSAPPVYAYAPAYPAPTVYPPRQTVIEYPHGRYELRGDGVTTPYTWLWIPNAPPPPPEEPASPPPDEPTSTAPRSPSPRGPVYRWTDEQGVVHWTDRLDTVPVQHRTGALQPS